MFFIFQPIYLQQMGASPLLIGSLFGAMGFMYAASQIPAGLLSDRIGNRVLLWAAWLIALVATLLMAFSTTLPVFIVGMLLYGWTAYVTTPLNAYTASLRGNLSVPRAMTLISACFQLGATIGPFLGGVIGDRYGLRTVYQLSLVFFVPSTFALFWLRKEKNNETHLDVPRTSFIRNKVLIIFVVLAFFTTFATYLPQPLTPNFLQNERQLSLRSIGNLGSIGSLGNAMIALSLGGLGTAPGFIIGQGLVAAFSLIIWQGTGAWLYLGYFMLGGYRLFRLMGMAFTRSLVYTNHTGKAFGLLETANATASILAPMFAGILYTQSPTWIYSFALFAILAMMVINSAFFALHKRIQQRKAKRNASSSG